MNAPDPLHWTLNSCIAAFRSVWVHFGLFRYCTKLGTKWAELVQLMHMFLPRSRIRMFRNKHTRSTPLDPKLMFWCISLYLGAFGNVLLLHETRCKMGWTGAIHAQVRAMKSHQNFSQWTESIHPIGPETHVCVRLIVFGCIWQYFVTTRNSVQNGLNWCN